jgi:hypothetical protein
MATIEDAVKTLEIEVEKLKKANEGVTGWLKKWGAIIGFIAAFFALPKGVIDLYSSVLSHPKTSVMRGERFDLEYDPGAQRMKATFNFSTVNAGTEDDTITELWATLRAPGSSSDLVSFDTSKFHVTDKGQEITIPFSIAKGTSRDFHCVVESSLDKESIPNKGGQWLFDVRLGGRKRSIPMDFQYKILIFPQYIAELKATKQTFKFLNPQ